MSLSKYYKDSSSFKREKIVTSHSPDVSGWKTKTTAPAPPFKPGSIKPPVQADFPTPAPPVDLPNSTEQAPAPTPDPVPVSSSDPESEAPTPQNPAPSIDLSNYVSIEEAEKKALEMYKQGVQEGTEKANEDFGAAAKTLSTICEQLDTIRETIISNSSNELQDFALLIAEKIIRISLKEQDQSIIATIKEALSHAVKSDEFTIFIHPDDYQTIADKSADLIAGVSGLTNIVIKTDPTIDKGGAKIESENCIIDATVISQFETIRDEINKGRE